MEARAFRKVVRSQRGGVLYAVLRQTPRTYLVVRWDAAWVGGGTVDMDRHSITVNPALPINPLVAFTADEALPGYGYQYPGGLARVERTDKPRSDAIAYAVAQAAREEY